MSVCVTVLSVLFCEMILTLDPRLLIFYPYAKMSLICVLKVYSIYIASFMLFCDLICQFKKLNIVITTCDRHAQVDKCQKSQPQTNTNYVHQKDTTLLSQPRPPSSPHVVVCVLLLLLWGSRLGHWPHTHGKCGTGGPQLGGGSECGGG